MLSVFPEILFLSPIAATLIRFALAILFGYTALRRFSSSDIASRTLMILEAVVAAAFFVGLWTQPAALLATIIAAIWYFQPTARITPPSTILLAFVMALSLIFTGPGAFAFDLPL